MSRIGFLQKTMACALALGATVGSALADTAERAFFEDKTIRLIVGYSPGGGYDIYARMIAPYLRKYLKATVVVENKPGAGGITALNGIAIAPPDGLQIMLVKGNAAIMAQLTGQTGVRYDMQKLNFLGGTGVSPDTLVVGPSSPVRSVTDLTKRQDTMLWAASGPMDGLSDGAALTCQAFSIKCKIIMGYRTTNDAALALARGESEGMLTNESSAFNYVKGETVRVVAIMGHKRSRFFPNTPTIFETPGLTDEQKFWFDFRANVDVFGRVLVTPPGMSKERLAFMQAAAKSAMTDPDLIAEGEKTMRYIEYQDAETIRKLQETIFRQIDTPTRTKINAMMKNFE